MPSSSSTPAPACRSEHSSATEPPASARTAGIDQAIALRDLLRDAASKATELIRAFQQEKKRSR